MFSLHSSNELDHNDGDSLHLLKEGTDIETAYVLAVAL